MLVLPAIIFDEFRNLDFGCYVLPQQFLRMSQNYEKENDKEIRLSCFYVFRFDQNDVFWGIVEHVVMRLEVLSKFIRESNRDILVVCKYLFNF
jgi:hypothetical protein